MLYIPYLRRTQPLASENAQKGASHRPSIRANFGELRDGKVRTIPLPRSRVNRRAVTYLKVPLHALYQPFAADGQRDAMFVGSANRRSTVSQDELIILVVVLMAWGFGTASIVLN